MLISSTSIVLCPLGQLIMNEHIMMFQDKEDETMLFLLSLLELNQDKWQSPPYFSPKSLQQTGSIYFLIKSGRTQAINFSDNL